MCPAISGITSAVVGWAAKPSVGEAALRLSLLERWDWVPRLEGGRFVQTAMVARSGHQGHVCTVKLVSFTCTGAFSTTTNQKPAFS